MRAIKVVILVIALFMGLTKEAMGEEPAWLERMIERFLQGSAIDDEDYRRGYQYYLNKDYDKAISFLKKSVEKNPDGTNNHKYLYEAARDSGRIEEILDFYQELLRKRPDHHRLNYRLAIMYRLSGFYDEAIEKYQWIVKKYPPSVEAQIQLGRLYSKQNRYEEAIERFNIVLKESDNGLSTWQRSYAHTYLGKIYHELGRPDDSIRELKEAIKINPDFYWPHNQLAKVYWGQKRYDDAAAELKESIRLNSEKFWAKRQLTILERRGLITSAESRLFKITVGEEAPRFALLNLKGDVTEFRPVQGKVTILGFYAVWCGVSIGPVAKLKEVEKGFKDSDVEVVAAVFLHGSAKPIVKPFVERYKLNFPILVGESGFQEMAFEDLEAVREGDQETINFLRKVRGLEEACHGVGMMPLKPLILIIDKQGIIRFIHQDYPDMGQLK